MLNSEFPSDKNWELRIEHWSDLRDNIVLHMSSLAEFSRATLEAWTIDARSRTLGLVRDLSDDEFLRVPLLRIINPFLWEIGHVAYFQEYWVLRHAAGKPPLLPDADGWYDSAKV